MSGMIVIGQNEAARLSKDSKQTLATVGLFGCIAAVLQGPNGITLVHVDSHTDLQFLVEEYHRLGKPCSIELFKKAGMSPDLANKIINHLKTNSIPFGLDHLTEVVPVPPIPFGVITASLKGSGQPPRDICIKLATMDTEKLDIDFGPQDLQMRSYKQQMFIYLNPELHRAPTVIYAEDSWQDAFELSSNDSNLLKYLFGIKPGQPLPESVKLEDVKARVKKMLSNNSSGYKEKFATEYMKYRLGSPHGIHLYDVQFPELLVRAYNYIVKTGLAFDKPTPKTGTFRPILPVEDSLNGVTKPKPR